MEKFDDLKARVAKCVVNETFKLAAREFIEELKSAWLSSDLGQKDFAARIGLNGHQFSYQICKNKKSDLKSQRLGRKNFKPVELSSRPLVKPLTLHLTGGGRIEFRGIEDVIAVLRGLC